MASHLSLISSLLLLLSIHQSHCESVDPIKIKRVFESLLELDGRADQRGGRLPPKATYYMKNLYEEAARSGMKGTVRTVAPIVETWEGEEVLLFPLSHLQIGHRLIRAELHMLGGRPDKMARALRIEGISGGSINVVDRVPLKLLSVSGEAVLWNAVHPILYNFANSTNLVIKMSRYDGRRMRPLPSFVSRHSPFLTIYTRSEDEEGSMKKGARRIKRTPNSGGGYFTYESEDSNILQKGAMEYIEKGPSMLNTRVKGAKFTRRRYEKLKKEKPFWGFGDDADDDEEDEEPNKILRIGSEGEHQEQIGERTLEMTTAINGNEMDVVLLHPEENRNTICTKQPLHVDFNEIGWVNWVIEPRQFDAGICGGNCPFPLPKEVRASNHALVQSALSSGSSSGLPAVCCAPDKMDSLTLLYYDANQNIILRNFPRMIVKSCGCI